MTRSPLAYVPVGAVLWAFLILCPLWLVAAWLLTAVAGFSNLEDDGI